MWGSRKRRERLWSIAYFSRLSASLTERELSGLALHAQMRNETLGITGILFLADEHVVQILEGQRGPVSWLYDQIVADPRHGQVVKLVDRSIDERGFEGWSMRLTTATDLRKPERTIVLDALRSNDQGDHDKVRETLTADLLACPGALIAGVFRKPSSAPHLVSAAE